MRRRVHRWTEGANPTLAPASSDRSDDKPCGHFLPCECPSPGKPRARAGVHVVGIDLSLRAAAACAIPMPWDFDLGKVRTLKTGSSLRRDATPKERIERMVQIAHDISVFCVNVKAVRVGLEEYAYAAGGSNAHQIAECGGALKVDVLETLGLAVYPVQASTARKVLLQHVPRLGAGKTKPWVVANVRRLGGPALEWTEDECDAFTICNTVLMHAGATAMSFPGH